MFYKDSNLDLSSILIILLFYIFINEFIMPSALLGVGGADELGLEYDSLGVGGADELGLEYDS